ncbi:MAG: hypothetical protein N2Z57_08075 [Oscillospiraceae bacterium]|nr:hypothetical protein [Oscillospiraceae bacterium]
MEGAKDPDEYIKKYGAIRFKVLLDNSGGAIAFELEKCKAGIDIETETGKVEYLKRCVQVLADISSPIEREVYISKICLEQNVSKEIIKAQTEALIKKRINTEKKLETTAIFSRTQTQDKINPEAIKFPKESKAETGLIAYLFFNPDKLDYVLSKLPPEKFVTSFNKKVYEKLANIIKNSHEFSLSSLNSEFDVDEMGKISEIIVKNKGIAISEKEADDYINVLLGHKNNNAANSDLSDEDFINLVNEIKKSQHKKEGDFYE